MTDELDLCPGCDCPVEACQCMTTCYFADMRGIGCSFMSLPGDFYCYVHGGDPEPD